MDLWHLRVFLTVASERSFSRAAEKLYRTQPAVSLAIRRLEADLGERLFHRRTKNGVLTPAGKLLEARGARLLQLADETAAAFRTLREPSPAGAVTIGANEAAIQPLLPLVARFRERCPGAPVEIRRVPARRLGDEIAAGTVALGVIVSQRLTAGLRAVTIATDDLVALVPPSHPFAGRPQIGMEEFQREAVIAHNEPSPARDHVMRLFERRGFPMRIVMWLPSLDAIKRAVETGHGITLLPRRCAQAELADGRLAGVPVAQVSWRRELRLVYGAEAELGPEALAFLDVARAGAPAGDGEPGHRGTARRRGSVSGPAPAERLRRSPPARARGPARRSTSPACGTSGSCP